MKTPHRWFTRDPNSILPTAQVRVVDESDYDALLAERDALQQQVESLQNKWAQRPLSVADTAALEAENDALRADAERYRWLREKPDRITQMDDAAYALWTDEQLQTVEWAEALNAAIDAANSPAQLGDEQ